MSKAKPNMGIQFEVAAPNAQAVYLAGSFNDWSLSTTAMAKDTNGRWSCNLELPAGRYEYKFVVDGQWCFEAGWDGPCRDSPDCVPNDFGTMNRVIEISVAVDKQTSKANKR